MDDEWLFTGGDQFLDSRKSRQVPGLLSARLHRSASMSSSCRGDNALRWLHVDPASGQHDDLGGIDGRVLWRSAVADSWRRRDSTGSRRSRPCLVETQRRLRLSWISINQSRYPLSFTVC